MPNEQILVVEDENIVAMDIKNILDGLGYRVPAVVSSGEEAIQKAEETRPDLVLMDIVLKGGMNGIEAARQIQDRLDIPVVYLTAYSDHDTLWRAKITEPHGYILKPFEERRLHSTIEIALYRHKVERKLNRWIIATLRSIGDAVVAVDKMGLVEFMNPVAEAMTGWNLEDALGRGLTEVLEIMDEKGSSLTEGLASRANREVVVIRPSDNILFLSRDGRERPIDGSVAPIRDDEGDTIGIVLVFRDITERRRSDV